MSGSWFEQLEAQLEQQLEAFLSSRPEQRQLLVEEEQRERQQRLKRRQLEVQAEAERLRRALLELATEITQWQGRVERARAAGASALADQAEARLRQLMALGRDRWQALSSLGDEFRRLDADLAALQREQEQQAATAAASGAPAQAGSGERGPGPAGATQGSQAEAAGAAAAAASSPATPLDPIELEAAWSAFVAQQELEELRRRHGTPPV
ncbi:hercynine metabolism protein [Synechococcus sp. MW101C3]|uniref:hercynine metabolism protein n=1 Tax=Synechococcus sp. MW101C3 TaxID=210768 RepID=UPI000B982655|nr:hercynine metabolism protein [Synechococcus sp. MW101C3]